MNLKYRISSKYSAEKNYFQFRLAEKLEAKLQNSAELARVPNNWKSSLVPSK